MTSVVFETPGLIDLRAFTIMGAHAKPNSPNPIGFFGTGLKYAIAVAVRLGDEPTVWVGRDKITFSKKASKFRGSDLETIKMTVVRDGKSRGVSYELPFTTRYGARWEAWMAFRELESNTRDEGGRTYLLDTDEAAVVDKVLADNDGMRTRMVFSAPGMVDAARAIDSIFLLRARREGRLLEAISADDRPNEDDANWVFYRTMRAMKTDKPTINTYNVLETCNLTEDRTLAYSFQVRDVLARWVLSEATESQVEAIVTADEEWWEHGLEYPGHVAPSEAFRAVMERRPKGLSRYASGYWSGHLGAGSRRRPPKAAFRLFSEAPKPWRLSGDFVFDANKVEVFERPDDMSADVWDDVAIAIIVGLDAGDRGEVIDAEPVGPPALPAPESVEEQGGGIPDVVGILADAGNAL